MGHNHEKEVGSHAWWNHGPGLKIQKELSESKFKAPSFDMPKSIISSDDDIIKHNAPSYINILDILKDK